jgi:hypothetical protein
MTRTSTKLCTLTKHQVDSLRTAISVGPVKPFLVTLDRSGTELVVHVARETTKASSGATFGFYPLTKRDFSNQISALGLDLSIRIKLYSRAALDKPRSLEAFIAKFAPGERLYDPISAFDEAERLVGFACELRRRLEGDLRGIYWNSRWRTIYVLLNDEAFVDGGYGLLQDKLIAAERSVVEAHQASTEAGVPRNVRLCFNVPVARPLVPLDDASFVHQYAQSLRNPAGPRLLQLATLARVPILSALLGMGSAGVAVAKLPPVENLPMQTSVDTAGAVSGLAAGAVRRNASIDRAPPGTQILETKTKAGIHSEGTISRDTFFEVTRIGATFDASPTIMRERKLDLRWLPDRERISRSESNASTGAPGSRGFPAMQPGITGVFGLSSLMGSDLSGEAYDAVLKDVQAHFGLPRSLRAEAFLHFVATAGSAPASDQNREFFHRKVRNPSNDGPNYRRNPDQPAQSQRSRSPRGQSGSS